MFHINRLHLKDAICFGDTSFQFKPGITTIYGLNRTNARTSGNGNAGGKSAFFSQVGEILFEDPVVGEKQDKVTHGMRTLSTTISNRQVEISRKDAKLVVTVDGKQKKFRTKAIARQWMNKVIPLTQEDFNTYGHIDSRIPHPLVMGTSTERSRFFSSFFGLSKMDVERKLFTAELARLKEVRAGFTEVLAEYRLNLTKVDPNVDQTRLEGRKIKEELEKLTDRSRRLQAIQQLMIFEESAAAQLQVLRTKVDSVSQESFDEAYEIARKNLADDQQGLEEAQAWEQYQRDTEHYTKAYAELSDDARKLIAKLGLKEAQEKCKDAAKKLRTYEADLREASSNLRTVEQQQAEPMPKKVLPPEEDKKELQARFDSLEHQYEHARRFKKGTCETCGQSVKVKDPAAIKAKMDSIEAKIDQHGDAETYAEALETMRSYKRKAKEAQAAIEHLEPLVKTCKRYSVLVDELLSIPRKPKPFEGRKLEVKVKQRMVDEDKELIAVFKFLKPNLDTILELERVTDAQREAVKSSTKLQTRINDLGEKLSKIRASMQMQKMVHDDVQRLRSKLRVMRDELKNEEALKLLVAAYSDKAMKRMVIQAISSRLMQEINKYARVVFPEDYSFEFIWRASQMNIMVYRKYGKRVLSSDVRKLSGAESKLFTICLVLALLTFVPKRKRCNVLILDEPAANFSRETMQSFKNLLPVLNKVIPSIIIITPKADETYEGAECFTVVKTKGLAEIVKGHPDSLGKLQQPGNTKKIKGTK